MSDAISRDAAMELLIDGECCTVDDLVAGIAALPAVTPGVKIKPLVWRDSYGVMRAESPFGDYKVVGKILYRPNSLAVQSVHGNMREAQAAAQADYEARIMAALDMTTQPDEAEKWKRAFAAQSRKLQAVLHIPGVKDALAEMEGKS